MCGPLAQERQHRVPHAPFRPFEISPTAQ